MSSADLPLVLLLVFLLVAAVFLAAAETSLLRISEVRARSAAENGGRRAVRLLHLVERLPAVLNLILLLALLTQIGAATITGVLAQRWFGNLAVTVASVVLTMFLYVYGEAIPKTYAVRHPMRTAMFVAAPVALLERLLRPVVRLLVWIADIQMPGSGITTSSAVSELELRYLATEAAEEGEITQRDRELIDRVFRFGDRRVNDIMVPRPDIVAVDISTATEAALDVALDAGHRRLLVYEGALDHIVGVVRLRDLVAARDSGTEDLGTILFEPLVVPESKRITSLLGQMQMEGIHLAVVVDEYGVTVGMVTIEDVVEELVGRFSERQTMPDLERIDERRWRVAGSLPVEDLAAEIGVELPEGDWNTVAGLMLGTAGRMLVPGSSVEVGGFTLRVESVRGRRVVSVLVERGAGS